MIRIMRGTGDILVRKREGKRPIERCDTQKLIILQWTLYSSENVNCIELLDSVRSLNL
jgi:hypothetical protein